jgi:hypothetical protein
MKTGHIYNLAGFFLEWEMFQKKSSTQYQNTPYNVQQLLFPQNRAFCEVMWKNTVETVRPQMAI